MKKITLLYDGNIISWNEETKNFVAEASSLGIAPGIEIAKNIFLKKGDKEIKFKFDKCDMDGSQEDVYGWRFKSYEGAKFPCGFTLIND